MFMNWLNLRSPQSSMVVTILHRAPFFLVSRYALFFQLVFSCFNYCCNIFFLHFKFIQLIRGGDIEIQPDPIKNALKFCHWNMNSVLAHDRIKISLLKAYNSVYNYDILVLGETYLSGDISHDETFIEAFSKNPFRKDDPSGLHNSGVCIYFKENLLIKRCVDLETLCAEGIVTEITLHHKKIFFVGLYRSHGMSSDDFVLFIQCLELLLDYMHDEKPHCIIFTGDFNCRSQQWWPVNIENEEGVALDEFIESNNLTQLIDQPTHIMNESRSCIDLIITDQPNILVNYGVHPSLYKTYHYEIMYGKINLSVPPPPSYKRKI